MRKKFRRNRIFRADSSSIVEMSRFLTQSVTKTPLESQVLMQSVECHSKTAAVSEHCHHFSAFNEQCHISFLSNMLSTIPNFWQCSQKNVLEIVLNLFPFGHTQINSMKASTRYLGLKGKHFQGYQNDFEAESITGCGAPWPRIDNAGLMPGYPKISRSRAR